jgi:hypothetical protein
LSVVNSFPIRTLLGNRSDSSSYVQVVAELQGEITRRQIEYCTLVANDTTIIAGANNDRRGEIFDPSGIVSAVLANPRRTIVVTTISRQEFLKEGSPRWLNSNIYPSNYLNSTLHPYSSTFSDSDLIVIRFCATPVYEVLGPFINTATPDGVLVYGDIVNGKAQLNEIVLQTFGEGYAGTVYFNGSTNSLQMLSSVFKSGNQYSYDYQSNFISNALKDALPNNNPSSAILAGTGTANGNQYEVAIERVASSYFYDCQLTAEPDLIPQFFPTVYMVRASSYSMWTDLQQTQKIISAVTLAIQIVTAIVISVILCKPMWEFIKRIRSEAIFMQEMKGQDEDEDDNDQTIVKRFGKSVSKLFRSKASVE